jgi:outer membrane protein
MTNMAVPRTSFVVACILALACAPALPGPSGARPTAVRPDTLWTPPARRPRPEPPALVSKDLPPEMAARRSVLTLEDVVALALEGSPDAQASWAQARAQAAAYGSARGAWFPEITGDASIARLKTAATQGRSAVEQTLYVPSASFTWLLLDLGGRSGGVTAAREALISSNWSHNATLQAVVAQTAGAFFDYSAAKALLTAQQTTLKEAELNLEAAEERRRVGVATIADVLQARTAAAQARLDLQTLEGNLFTTRGALAAATGFPATLDYDIDTSAVAAPVAALGEEVDSLIVIALRDRPDLAAIQAEYQEARARVGIARAQRLPAITAGGTAAMNYRSGQSGGNDSYSLSVGLSIPLFNGFIWEYNQKQAEFLADAAAARSRSLAHQVVFQVFQSYYALRTATARVSTADDLLASATESAAAARGRYQGGVGTLLELLSAENALASARAQRIQARLGWQAALVQLARDAGVLDLQGKSPLRLTPVSAAKDSLP